MSEQWQKPIGIEPAIFPADQAPEPVAEIRNNNLYWLVDDDYEVSDGPLYAAPPDLAAELAEVKKELEAKLRVIVSLEGAMEMQRIFYEQCRKEHHRVVAEQIRYIDYERARAEKAEAALAMCDIGLAEASALLKEAGIPCLGLAHARAAIRGAKK